MDYDILKSVSQGSDGAQDAENSRIEAISDELNRCCKLYEAQLGDGQPHVGPFEIEPRITESFAKEHGSVDTDRFRVRFGDTRTERERE